MKIKKVLKACLIGATLVGSVFVISGCAPNLANNGQAIETQAQLDNALQNKFNSGIDSVDVEAIKTAAIEGVDITTDNAEVTAEVQALLDAANDKIAELDAQILADAEEVAEEIEREELGLKEDGLTFGTTYSYTYDDSDLNLFDGKIGFDGDDYDAREIIEVTYAVLTSGTGGENEFEATPYLTFQEGSVAYKYEFDKGINLSNLDEDEPLEINILGMPFEIVDESGDEITVNYGAEYFLESGESIEVEDKTVFLKMVGDGYIYAMVGDEGKKIFEFNTKTINDVEIYVKEVMNQNDGPDYATLKIGEEITKDINDGDDVEEFGENYIDMDDAEWIWDINLNAVKPYISVKLNIDRESIDEDEEYPAIALGESLILPNNFAEINFYKLSDAGYQDFKFDFDDNMLEIRGTEEFVMVDDVEVDNGRVYFDGTNIFYEVDDVDYNSTIDKLELVNDETEITFNYNGTTNVLTLVEPDIDLTLDLANDKFTDILRLGTSIKEHDEEILGAYGEIIENPEDNFDSQEFKIAVPSEQVEATVKIL